MPRGTRFVALCVSIIRSASLIGSRSHHNNADPFRALPGLTTLPAPFQFCGERLDVVGPGRGPVGWKTGRATSTSLLWAPGT